MKSRARARASEPLDVGGARPDQGANWLLGAENKPPLEIESAIKQTDRGSGAGLIALEGDGRQWSSTL